MRYIENSDPFASFMEQWAPSMGMDRAFDAWLIKNGEKYSRYFGEAAYTMPDLQPFKSNDGAYITGRSHWRRHLKENNLQEFGREDLKKMGEARVKKQEAFRARLNNPAARDVRPVEVPSDFQRANASRLQVEVANRLHGKPTPARKELIKLSLDLSRRMKRG